MEVSQNIGKSLFLIPGIAAFNRPKIAIVASVL
jgi:hypothetical protein